MPCCEGLPNWLRFLPTRRAPGRFSPCRSRSSPNSIMVTPQVFLDVGLTCERIRQCEIRLLANIWQSFRSVTRWPSSSGPLFLFPSLPFPRTGPWALCHRERFPSLLRWTCLKTLGSSSANASVWTHVEQRRDLVTQRSLGSSFVKMSFHTSMDISTSIFTSLGLSTLYSVCRFRPRLRVKPMGAVFAISLERC